MTTQPAYITRTKRFRCPVHQGKNLSVAVGYIDGRAWAKCWSQGCASADILAALGITNAQSIPWTPPPPRPRPTLSVDYLPPVSPFAASEYLKGILTPLWLMQSSTNATTASAGSIGGVTPSGGILAWSVMAGNSGDSTPWNHPPPRQSAWPRARRTPPRSRPPD